MLETFCVACLWHGRYLGITHFFVRLPVCLSKSNNSVTLFSSHFYLVFCDKVRTGDTRAPVLYKLCQITVWKLHDSVKNILRFHISQLYISPILDNLYPLPDNWPKIPAIFRRRSCELTASTAPCVNKAVSHLELLQNVIEDWFKEKDEEGTKSKLESGDYLYIQ